MSKKSTEKLPPEATEVEIMVAKLINKAMQGHFGTKHRAELLSTLFAIFYKL